MKITVMGSDHAGLVVGAYAAELGNQVICHDMDTHKIQSLRRCKIPACDPQLRDMLARNKGAGRLTFSHDAIQSITHGELIFITQGIGNPGQGAADCTQVAWTVKNIHRWGKACKVVFVIAAQPPTIEHRIALSIDSLRVHAGLLQGS